MAENADRSHQVAGWRDDVEGRMPSYRITGFAKPGSRLREGVRHYLRVHRDQGTTYWDTVPGWTYDDGKRAWEFAIHGLCAAIDPATLRVVDERTGEEFPLPAEHADWFAEVCSPDEPGAWDIVLWWLRQRDAERIQRLIDGGSAIPWRKAVAAEFRSRYGRGGSGGVWVPEGTPFPRTGLDVEAWPKDIRPFVAASGGIALLRDEWEALRHLGGLFTDTAGARLS